MGIKFDIYYKFKAFYLNLFKFLKRQAMKKVVLFLASAVLLWGANLETKTLESMCENKDAKSCFELGNKFEESKNYQKAGEFYKKLAS